MTKEQHTFFEKLYQENYDKLYLHAYALLRERSSAEVAVQEAAQDACQKIGVLMSSPNPIGWMYKAVEYAALHMLRDINRDQAMFSPLEEYYHESSGVEPEASDNSLVKRCLEIVTKEEFDFFYRLTIEGSTYQDEAHRAGIALWACYKRGARIRKKLQKGLGKNFMKNF